MKIKEKYQKEVAPQLMEEFGYKNKMAVPKLIKATINVGIGKNKEDSKYIETVENTIQRITGQKPVFTKAKKSISAFKVREGMKVGVKTTLRGSKMWDFLEKLIGVALPRVRDFRGVPTKVVDKTGNLNVGFKEHIVFPEIKSDEVEKLHGLEISVTTTATTYEEGVALFKKLGFPFKS